MSAPLPFRATINTTYATFFEAPVRFTLIALPAPLGFALWALLATAIVRWTVDEDVDQRWATMLAVAALALQYAIFILCMGALIDGARQVRHGRRLAVADAFATAFIRLFEMVASSLPILCVGLLFLRSAVAFSSLTWMAAAFVLAIVDLTVLALSMPICLIERRGSLASLGRSLRLTRGSRLRFLAAAFVTHLPIGLSLWIFRLAGNGIVDGALSILAAAWHIVLLSILSVVALDALSPPETAHETPG